MTNQLENLQKQVAAKDGLVSVSKIFIFTQNIPTLTFMVYFKVEQLTTQLKSAQDTSKQLEQKLLEMNQQVDSLNSQVKILITFC